MRLLAKALMVIGLAVLLFGAIDFIRFPEWYLTTWRYQLKNDIERGDKNAIEYYESHYLKYGRVLFKDYKNGKN